MSNQEAEERALRLRTEIQKLEDENQSLRFV